MNQHYVVFGSVAYSGALKWGRKKDNTFDMLDLHQTKNPNKECKNTGWVIVSRMQLLSLTATR